MKYTADKILQMPVRQLQRLVAKMQVEIAKWERFEAGGGDPDAFEHFDEQISIAKKTEREIQRRTKQTKPTN